MCEITNFYVCCTLLSYMGEGIYNLRSALPPCSEPVPLRIFWSGYGPDTLAVSYKLSYVITCRLRWHPSPFYCMTQFICTAQYMPWPSICPSC